MSKKIRVGVVGTSWFTETFHIASLKSHPRADVVAVCGRRQDYTEEIARKHGIRQAFNDYEAMIWHGNLDAVVVSSPDDLHHPISMTALDAGLHVMCEKPLALNAAQAREMATRAESKGVVHMTSFGNRWRPYFQYMKQLVEEGYTGKAYHSHFRSHAGYGRDGLYAWRFDRRRANGILGDLGSHMIDLARWLVGEIEWVTASLGVHVERPGPEGGTVDPANDTVLLNLGFTGGAQGSILVSAVSHIADRGMEQNVSIYGQGGSLELSHSYFGAESTPRLIGTRSTEERFSSLTIPAHHLKGLDLGSPTMEWLSGMFTSQPAGDRLFVDAILEGRKPAPDFTDGLRVMEVIDAAIESDRTGRRVFIHGGSE